MLALNNDAEKIVQGLKCHFVNQSCDGCPYYQGEMCNNIHLESDAIALIEDRVIAKVMSYDDIVEWMKNEYYQDSIYIECYCTADIGYVPYVDLEGIRKAMDSKMIKVWTRKPTAEQSQIERFGHVVPFPED